MEIFTRDRYQHLLTSDVPVKDHSVMVESLLQKQRDLETLVNGLSDQLENDDDEENDGEGDQGAEQVVNGHGKCNMYRSREI